ncbi:hypothetical protein MPL3356_60606 [Mesorhizobium plurifarium]|uniref:Uncharacterized protein n=1 Tax=Mesorhizobium plurifarium TaxID=69974 RepID=A0A090EFY5_MESPL|nr:hypothetical protein MPL3356_60606 [Mesorhizobium plurifarium]
MRRSEQQAARDRVLDALTTIQMFDTDPAFREIAKRRYLEMMAAAASRRSDGGADIVMTHTAIAGQ